jgi:hypothetical protein
MKLISEEYKYTTKERSEMMDQSNKAGVDNDDT